MQLFSRLFSSLNGASVKYLVAGGIAVNLYGIQRSTADIDLVLKLDEENIDKFLEVVQLLGLKAKVPVPLEQFRLEGQRARWVREKGMRVFSFYDAHNPFFLLDVFVEEPFDFDRVYRSRRDFALDDIAIPVVPITELIAMKEISDRPQDRADIYFLRKVLEEWTHEG
ncbi:MAG: nucleotidyl transferase AbiEii/AbiGii toxin family protein [Desulforhabdus sp.]|jgi:hypothetical protein|nr:nucleotidyl transferase AbiEii/AbiGii toxin family protein [Desulforhabdus sp.]